MEDRHTCKLGQVRRGEPSPRWAPNSNMQVYLLSVEIFENFYRKKHSLWFFNEIPKILQKASRFEMIHILCSYQIWVLIWEMVHAKQSHCAYYKRKTACQSNRASHCLRFPTCHIECFELCVLDGSSVKTILFHKIVCLYFILSESS